MKRFRAVVVGGTGYGGAELIRRLLIHPEVELVRVVAVDHVGEPLGAVHPPLTGRTPLVFENIPPVEAAQGCDIALLGLPHKVSAQHAPALLAAGVKVVDMSGDFRLRDAAAYKRYYGATHPHPEMLGTWVYGLPELNREAIRSARAVASPGCFATTIALALLPLARAGKLSNAVVHVVGMTGSSGSGVAPAAGTHHPVRAVNLKTYKVLEHQHTPEITETLAAAGAPGVELRFVPVSAPLSRGILATSFVEVPAAETDEAIAALYEAAYAREPFTRFVRDRLPEVAAVSGSNYAEVGFTLGAAAGATRTLAIVSATDNLIKGGAGQAIQNMNLMLGLPETASLEDPGAVAVGQPVAAVVKLGGDVLAHPALGLVAGDLARAAVGRRLVIVHGGGPQATALSRQLGIEPRIVGGRRITDGPTLDVMKAVVSGRLNVDLVAALRGAGLSALGLSGSSGVIKAHRRPPRVVSGAGPEPVDFGLVGDVDGFDRVPLDALAAAGYLPVLACLAAGPGDEVLNINADVVASQLAAALAAGALVACTAVGGVRRDKDDAPPRMPRLTVAEAQAAIRDGVVQGGMIPKLEEAFAPLAAGVGAVHIVAPGEVAASLAAPGSVGTLLVP